MLTLIVVVVVVIAIAACALLGLALWGQSINRAQAKGQGAEQAETGSQSAPQLEPTSPDPAPVSIRAPEPPLTPARETAKPRPKSKNQVAIDYDRIACFPDIATKQARCVGMMHYLSDNQRRTLNPPFVIAVPEPSNSHDPNAVIIASIEGRRYGYLSAGQAKMYSALIQEVGSLQLNCRTEGSKLWLDLPTVSELRKSVRERKESGKPFAESIGISRGSINAATDGPPAAPQDQDSD